MSINSIFHTPRHAPYLPLTLILFLYLMTSCTKVDQTEQSHKGPGHPAWQEQWTMMKTEASKEIPQDFALKMHKQFHKKHDVSRSNLSNLESIEELGPHDVAGRIRAFIVDWSNTDRYLAAGISGGLWESTDQGTYWVNLTPEEQHLNITSITQSPFDPDVFYFSTGEPTGNSAGISGPGIFKSTDGAKTFDLLPSSGVSEFFTSWRIAHSLTDSNTVYIATPTGLFVTRDGGEFFDHIKFSRFTDIEILPSGEMYASTDGLGVYYSPDGSDNSFKFVTQGLPLTYGRSQLAISKNNPNVVAVALEDNDDGTLLDIYYSADKGESWNLVPNPEEIGLNASFNWYCQTLYLHPSDPNFILYGASDGAYSFNLGEDWRRITNVHADIHSAITDPDDEDDILLTSDGGIDRLEKLGTTMAATSLNNGINITQFYTGAVFSNDDVVGGTQDNGTWFGSRFDQEFIKVYGADGAGCAVNPLDSNEVYVSYQNGNVFRLFPFYGAYDTEYIVGDIQYSEDNNYFIAPFSLNPVKPNQLFLPTRSRLWWSQNSGFTWDPLTLSRNSPFSTVTVNHGDSTTIFSAGSNGLFYRINHAESHIPGQEVNLHATIPTNVSLGFIREMAVHPNKQSLFIVFSSFSPEDRVWRVDDIYSNAPTWVSISGDLPAELPANDIVVNSQNPDVLAIGTDYGLFTTTNGGTNWTLEKSIPQTVIYQITLQPDNLLHIYTHGRGIFKAYLSDVVDVVDVAKDREAFQVYPNPVTDFFPF